VRLDARVRPPYEEFVDLSIWAPEEMTSSSALGVRAWPKSILERSLPALVDELAAAGVGKAIVHGRRAGKAFGSVRNETLAALRAMHPDLFVIIGGASPDEPDPAGETNRCLRELGFAGVVVDPGWLEVPRRADDPAFAPIYHACAAAGKPLFIVSGIWSGPDLTYSDPLAIQRVASSYPKMPIVVVHACWPHVLAIVGVAHRHKNVWLLPDFYMNIPGLPGGDGYAAAVRTSLRKRVLFGSGYPSRPVHQSMTDLDVYGFEAAVADDLLGGNAERLLGGLT